MSLKDDIIRLRKENKSYKAIARELGCSSGSISYHCSKLGLNKSVGRDPENDKKNIIAMRLVAKQLYDVERNRYFEVGRQLTKENKADDTLIKAVISYYCEGSKAPGGVVMANSDPTIHNIFAEFMNKYFPNYKSVVSFISYENGISKELVEEYWLSNLNIRNVHVGKHYRKKTVKGKQNCPYGTCYIRYQGVKYIWVILMGCIFELTGTNFIDKNYK